MQTELPKGSHLFQEVQFPKFFIWAIVLIVLAWNVFAYRSSAGIGWGLYLSTIILCILWCLPKSAPKKLAYIVSAVGIISSLLIGFRANGFVQGFNLVIASAASILLLQIFAISHLNWQVWSIIKSQWRLFVAGFAQIGLLQKYKSAKGTTADSKVISLVKTAAITIILLIFFAILLSSADPIFSKLIEEILNQSVGRALTSISLAAAFLITLTIKLNHPKEELPRLGFLNAMEMVIPVSALVGLFGLFLFVQTRYLFASHEVFQTFGLTYSQYVRRGFFELLTAAFLGGVISYGLSLKARGQEKKFPLIVVNSLLIIELILLLVSAYRRDLMYIEIYGLTRTRIIGEIFLYWLAGVLLLLLGLTIIKKFKEKHLLLGISGMTIVAMIYFNLFNMDARIVSAMPEKNGMKDFFYIALLSEDAVEGWKQILPIIETQFAILEGKTSLDANERMQLANMKLAIVVLEEKIGSLYISYNAQARKELETRYAAKSESERRRTQLLVPRIYSWQEFNLSHKQAYESIYELDKEFEIKLENLLKRITTFQTTNNIYLNQEEYQLRFNFDYPFVNSSFEYYSFPDPRDYIPQS